MMQPGRTDSDHLNHTMPKDSPELSKIPALDQKLGEESISVRASTENQKFEIEVFISICPL